MNFKEKGKYEWRDLSTKDKHDVVDAFNEGAADFNVGIYVGSLNPFIAAKIEETVPFDNIAVVDLEGEYRLAIIPNYYGPAKQLEEENAEIEASLLPIVLPIKDTYIEIL